jgi:flagellar M-ring protein FliF
MQGELARSIMMIEGIEFARVHLAIPERTIFRAGQGTPTAAVSLETTPGAALTDQKIRGIQQLVSSSVPGLAVTDVAVLDREGDLVSGSVGVAPAYAGGPQTERTALESYFAVKGRTAIEQFLPKGSFDLEISLRPLVRDAAADAGSEPVATQAGAGQTERLRDDFTFRVLMRTPTVLADEERRLVQNALIEAFSLAENRGDVLIFSTGALARTLDAAPASAAPARPAPVPAAGGGGGWDDSTFDLFQSKWLWIGLVLAALVGLAVWPRKRLSDEEIASFADLLKDAANDRAER